jgi:23S rRNA pseudouridine2605 synthase
LLIRLQRFLAQGGIASRRKAESLITEGHVRVNGRVVTEMGSRVQPGRDRIEVDGRRVVVERPVYLMLNKPRGYVTTLSDPEGRPTVMKLLQRVEERVYPVGRLDFNTEGLLLITNDGDLAHGLMHPRRQVDKVYRVKVRGAAGPELVSALERGVEVDGELRTASVTVLGVTEGGKNTWLEMTIHEGRNRQIHRMIEAVGLMVAKLERVGYGGLELGTLPRGKSRPLLPRELDRLRKLAGGAAGPSPGQSGRPGRPADAHAPRGGRKAPRAPAPHSRRGGKRRS